jgi:hypothetical protein
VELVRRMERQARQEHGYPADGLLGRMAQAAVERVALRRALVAQGLHRFTSSRAADPG